MEKLQTTSKRKTLALHTASTIPFLCKTNHLLYQCVIVSMCFFKQTPSRFKFIKNQKRCVNCFQYEAMFWKIVQILARIDSVVNGITHCYILIIPLSLSTLSNKSTMFVHTSSENAIATHLLSKTVAPSSQNLSRDHTCEFIYLINILSLFARFLIKDLSLHLSPNRFLNVFLYAFRELIAPLPTFHYQH